MNRPSLYRNVVLMAGLASLLQAQPTVSPDDMAAWSVIGADKEELMRPDGNLDLTANAQMYRSINGSRVTVQIDSNPVYGTTTIDLPVLELGDAALAFVRSESAGKLMLILGNNPALQLPFEIALDADHRSEQPLGITLSRLGDTVAVSLLGQTLQFPGGPSVNAQEIVLSAGATQSWAIQKLSILSELPILESIDDKIAHDENSAENLTENRTQQARERALAAQMHLGTVRSGESGQIDAKASAEDSPPTRRVRLQVFTPSSVRHGRVHLVRQAALKAAKN